MTEQVRFTATVEHDPETGEMVLPLEPEILDQLGWGTDDVLKWTDNGDGTFTITKVDK